jgi:hypothetical protein
MPSIALLNLIAAAVAYSDTAATQNPKRRFFDWNRQAQAIPVTNPQSRQYTVDPGATLSIFSGGRATAIDNTTAFDVTQGLDPSTYRFTAVSGTSPAFRTDRGLNLNGHTVTVTANTNGTVTLTDAGANFAGVQSGDTVFLPGLLDSYSLSPFNTLNQGVWSVLAVLSATSMTLRRPDGVSFSGVTETVVITDQQQVAAYSAVGVQVGDKVEISQGFALATRGTYVVAKVTPKWFEVVSAQPIALESGVLPTNSGLQFYTSCKKYLRVEVDQEAVVQLNGDTSQVCRVSPVLPADADQMGWFEKWGPTYSLSVVNRTAVPMSVNVFSCE